jgi:hypothetical protein
MIDVQILNESARCFVADSPRDWYSMILSAGIGEAVGKLVCIDQDVKQEENRNLNLKGLVYDEVESLASHCHTKGDRFGRIKRDRLFATAIFAIIDDVS